MELNILSGLENAFGMNLNEGHKLADQEPDVEQLEVGGGWEDLPHVDDDSGQHQHSGQVHTQGSFKEGWFEEHKISIGEKLFKSITGNLIGRS